MFFFISQRQLKSCERTVSSSTIMSRTRCVEVISRVYNTIGYHLISPLSHDTSSVFLGHGSARLVSRSRFLCPPYPLSIEVERRVDCHYLDPLDVYGTISSPLSISNSFFAVVSHFLDYPHIL